MSQNTQAGPVPTLGDSSNVPSDMLALANALGPQLCPPFATTAARDASTAGFKVCTVGDTPYVKVGSSWQLIQSLGPWTNLVLVSGFQTIAGNTLKVRKLGSGDLEMHGWVGPTAGNFPAAATKIASMPAGFSVPIWTVIAGVGNNVAATLGVEIRTDGGVYVTPSTGVTLTQCRIPVTRILGA